MAIENRNIIHREIVEHGGFEEKGLEHRNILRVRFRQDQIKPILFPLLVFYSVRLYHLICPMYVGCSSECDF